jgi:hypothetical protein
MPDSSGTIEEFVDHVRNACWTEAVSLAQSGGIPCCSHVAGEPIHAWIVDVDAPPRVVAALVMSCLQPYDILCQPADVAAMCMDRWLTHANAAGSFVALLAAGADANGVVGGGSRLLQYAISRDRPEAARALLRYGADPFALGVHGRESTSAVDDSLVARNSAAEVVIRGVNEDRLREHVRNSPLSNPDPEHPGTTLWEARGWVQSVSAARPK